MPLTRVRGSTWNTGDNLVINTMAEIGSVKEEGIIFVSGLVKTNDGMGGWYKWEPLEPKNNHDGVTIVDPTGMLVGRGCWVKQNYRTSEPIFNKSELQTASAGQTDFRLVTLQYTPGEGEIAIYVNGTRLASPAFVETNQNTVHLNNPLRAGDMVEFIVAENPTPGQSQQLMARVIGYDNTGSGMTANNVQAAIDELNLQLALGGGGGGSGGPQKIQRWDQSAGRDTFAFVHDRTRLNVFLNGVYLDPTLYIANGNQIVLNEPLQSNNDVLVAITIDSGGSGTTPTLPSLTATSILYTPVAPDISNNVQSAIGYVQNVIRDHIIDLTNAHPAAAIGYTNQGTNLVATDVQAAITELNGKVGSGRASGIVFDNTASGLLAGNVQSAIEELVVTNRQQDTRLEDHLHDPIDAHNAVAIGFTPDISLYPIFANAPNVDIALHKLADQLGTINLKAANVTYTNTLSGLLATNTQNALDEVASKLSTHTHPATQITYNKVELTATNVSQALDNFYTRYATHLQALKNTPDAFKHLAEGIRFNNAGTGFWSNNVQDAILEASGLGKTYGGNLDLTAAPGTPHPNLQNGYYFTSAASGTINGGWTNVLGVPVGGAVSAGDLLFYDGARYHYIGGTAPNWAGITPIVPNPAAGQNQTITANQPADNALVLAGQVGHTAPILVVNGDSTFSGNLRSSASVFDQVGNLRQTATTVSYDHAASQLVATDVKAALDEVVTNFNSHKVAAVAHNANQIRTTPVTGLSAGATQNAQDFLAELWRQIQEHEASNSAHRSVDILFDRTGTTMMATNVETAIKELFAGVGTGTGTGNIDMGVY